MQEEKSAINPFAVLYSDRPRFVIQDRIKHYKDAIELARLATKLGYDVEYENQRMLYDVKIAEGPESSSAPQGMSLLAAKRLLESE